MPRRPPYARAVDPVVALAVVVALVAATTAAGLVLRRRDGRLRATPVVTALPEAAPGATVTLVQFTTTYCSRCPGVSRLLRDLAAGRDGVVHREIDLTDRPDLAAEYRVLQTPTTLVLDHGGRLAARIAGVPRRDELDARLTTLLEGAS